MSERRPSTVAASAETGDDVSDKPGIFRRQRQIVVEVGSRGTDRRNRRTFKPENLVTQPGGTMGTRAADKKKR